MGVRPITGAVGGDGGRPMTAVRAAGFSSAANRGWKILSLKITFLITWSITRSHKYVFKLSNIRKWRRAFVFRFCVWSSWASSQNGSASSWDESGRQVNVSYRGEDGLVISYLLTSVNRCFSPEEKIKMMEKQVNTLIEESCLAASRGEFQLVSTQTTNIVKVLLLKKYVFF